MYDGKWGIRIKREDAKERRSVAKRSSDRANRRIAHETHELHEMGQRREASEFGMGICSGFVWFVCFVGRLVRGWAKTCE